jgi:hypothetical protein
LTGGSCSFVCLWVEVFTDYLWHYFINSLKDLKGLIKNYSRCEFTIRSRFDHEGWIFFIRNNKIASLSDSILFSNLTSLRKIDLSSNLISFIGYQTFTNIKNVNQAKINLKCNPLIGFNTTNKQEELCGTNDQSMCSICYDGACLIDQIVIAIFVKMLLSSFNFLLKWSLE